MKFKYRALKDGKEVSDVAEASDRYELSRQLRSQGITVVAVESIADKKESFITRLNERFSTAGLKHRIFFMSNMSEMLSVGLALARSLKVASKQTKNPKLKSIIADIAEQVSKGGSFATALARFPKAFPPTVSAMIEAGEKSGKLPESLEIVSTQMMKSYQLRKRIRGALMYPAIIIIAMILIGILMLVYMVPQLASTFEELGAELPFSTKVILAMSNFMSNHWLIAICIVLGVVVALYFASKTAKVKRIWAWFVLHFPIIGPIAKKANAATTSRTLSSLLLSGVEIVEALKITKKVLNNPYYKDVLEEATLAVPKGQALSTIFTRPEIEKIYPAFVGEMISVGEETGKMPDMLLKLAVFYEKEVDSTVKDLSTIIEPIIMVLVGAGVGFFALSMIQPIYQVGENI